MNGATRIRLGPMVLLHIVFLLFATQVRTQPQRGGRGDGPRTVRIAAASDLRFALGEMTARLHQRRPDLDLELTYGSSGTFFAQLINGAPFDLFLSADIEYPRQLAARGLTVPGSEFVYAIGRLAVWVPARSPLDVEKDGLNVLLDRRVMHVSIANPATAPYGRAAEAAMQGANIYPAIRSKLVLGDNVAQAFQFAQSGAADVGVIALSLARSPALDDKGRYWVVPVELHPRLEQGGVIMQSSSHTDAARAVRTFLIGDEGRAILTRYGFSLPGK